MTAPDAPPLQWLTPAGRRAPTARLCYRGSLAGADRPLTLHLGYDGWDDPRDVELERDDGAWTAELADTEGHHVLDCAVTDGEGWDNNIGANYRLWLALDPVDAHVHARTPGLEPMGFASLRTALLSGGMTHALVSWQDNGFVDRVADGVPWLTRLVWVVPGHTKPDDVRRRLADGSAGLKLHPAFDNYPADTPALDPYLEVAAEAGVPVTVHSSPGPADPDLIRRLAERFPQVPVVLYHTFLGFEEGRRRAARHAEELTNLYLETSWCRSAEVERLIDEVGPNRVLFGSDAAVDGPLHYVKTPPNIEMVENYNQGLLRLARRLPADTLHKLLADNTCRLFRLAPPSAGVPAPPPGQVPESVDATRELFAAALDQAAGIVAAVAPGRLDLPTPCADWTVRELLGHLVAVARRAGLAGEGNPATALPRVVHVDRADRWAPVFEAAAREARHAWADADAAPADVRAPWGLVPAPVVLSGFVLELVAHAHDLAVAVGRREPLDDALAEAALPIAERLVPAPLRGNSAAFGPPVEAPASAGPYGRLAAFLGRVDGHGDPRP